MIFLPNHWRPAIAAGAVLAVLSAGPLAAAEGVPLKQVLGKTDIHGLAFDAASPARLLLASHSGLIGIDLLTLRAAPVGTDDSDLMGFSQSPSMPGVAFASGHPAAMNGNLGVIGSTDGGVTWTSLSPGVDGPVDFHQMEVSRADPNVLFGVQHGQTIQQSLDAGVNWSVVGPAPADLIDIATSARDARRLFAATKAGLLQSTDGGATWAPALDGDGPVSFVDVGMDGSVFAFQLGRGLIRAEETDDGAPLQWQTVSAGPASGYFLQFARDPRNPDRIFAVTGENEVLSTSDGGATWAVVARP